MFLSFVNNEAVTTLLHMQLVNSDLYAFLSNKVLKKDQEHILMAGMMCHSTDEMSEMQLDGNIFIFIVILIVRVLEWPSITYSNLYY